LGHTQALPISKAVSTKHSSTGAMAKFLSAIWCSACNCQSARSVRQSTTPPDVIQYCPNGSMAYRDGILRSMAYRYSILPHQP
jgi:hypothetical protein